MEGAYRAHQHHNTSLMTAFSHGLQSGQIPLHSTALLSNNQAFSFQWLDQISSSIAGVLHSMLRAATATRAAPLATKDKDGPRQRPRLIGICAEPSEKAIACLFGILKLGLGYVPFDPSYPKERVRLMASTCELELFISDTDVELVEGMVQVSLDQVYDMAAAAGTDTDTDTDTAWNWNQPTGSGQSQSQGENIPMVLYTSGSSSTPKGVCLTHNNILNRLSWQWSQFPFVPSDICAWKTSLTFVDSICEIFGPLLAGRPLAIISRTAACQPQALVRALYEYQVTRLILVPSLLKAILTTVKHLQAQASSTNTIGGGDDSRNLLQSVRLWISSGEALSPALAQEFFRTFPRGAQLANFYGSTEIMGDVSYVTFTSGQSLLDKSYTGVKGQAELLPIGEFMVDNTVLYIVDAVSGQLAPDGVTGEIYIAGHNVTAGYLGVGTESDTDKDKFSSNPFHSGGAGAGFSRVFRTGDYGAILPTSKHKRLLFYKGRLDSQLKVRGQKVNLAEIESTIATELGHLVAKVCVLCSHPGTSQQALIAFIIPSSNQTRPRQLCTAIQSHLRPCELPEVALKSHFPLLVNGKIDRQTLLAEFDATRSQQSLRLEDWNSIGQTGQAIPTYKIESLKILVSIISEITGTPLRVIVENIQESFYILGGNSLNSVAVVVKLWENGFHIEIGEFISAGSIQNIVDYMKPRTNKQAASHHDAAPPQPIPDKQPYRLETMRPEHRSAVIQILSKGFSEKGDLERYTGATYEDYAAYIASIWGTAISNGLCFVAIRNSDSRLVGASFNYDYVHFCQLEPVESSSRISLVFEILAFVQSGLRAKLPGTSKLGQLLRSSMSGTDAVLDDARNVYVMELMSSHLTRLATAKSFSAILSINTSSLTQQIDRDVQGFETLIEYRINQFVAGDGSRPFGPAPDSAIVVCLMKYLLPKDKAEDKGWRA